MSVAANDKNPRMRHDPALSRGKPPVWLTVLAASLFGATAFVPLLVMLGSFLLEGLRDPQVFWVTLAAPRQLILLGRSLGVGMSVTLLSAAIGMPLGRVLTAQDLPGRRVFWWIALVPLVIPPYVLTGAWLHVLAPLGWLNQTLAAHGGPDRILRLTSWPGCIWCLTQAYTPIVVLFSATAWKTLDWTVVEAARLETQGWRLWRVAYWPQLKPHLLAAACFVLVFTLVQYSVPSLLGVQTYPVEIFTQFSAFYNESAAVAASVPLVVLVMALIFVQARVMADRPYVQVSPGSEGDARFTLGRWRWGVMAGLLLWWGGTLIWPFACVFRQSQGWRAILATARGHGDWILYTSIMALLTAVVATFLGGVLGPWLACGRSRCFRLVDLCCWFPLAWPGTVLGLGILKIGAYLPAWQTRDTWGLGLLLAYLGLFSAWAIRISQAGYRRLDPHVAELAVMDCPHWLGRWWYVDFRLLGPSFSLSLILVFVQVVGELNATILLIPPGKQTLAVSIDNLLHYGASATASALCLLEAGLVLVVVLLGIPLVQGLSRGRQHFTVGRP
jgi:iron(III) transport system permease protein